ncbi:MAG: hypothetical protein H7263_08165 [Candidatus Sericytochromatia bacterium]|nr:hypothetical protein [Candidatus Sericytochromatia bacterium]
MKINSLKIVLIGLLVSMGNLAEAAPSQKSFFSDNSTIIYGTQNKITAKDDNIVAYNLKKQMKSYLNITADNRVNEVTMRRNNLIILAHEKSNSLINFTNLANAKSNFPLTIGEGTFSFGKKTYSDKKAGISFIFPSPYNAKNYVLVYYSNSVEGLDNITKNVRISSDNEYQIINEQGKSIREGKFNKTNYAWRYDTRFDKDFERTIIQQ